MPTLLSCIGRDWSTKLPVLFEPVEFHEVPNVTGSSWLTVVMSFSISSLTKIHHERFDSTTARFTKLKTIMIQVLVI